MLQPIVQEEVIGCGIASVANSAGYLPSNIRRTFEAMQPKCFIEVKSA